MVPDFTEVEKVAVAASVHGPRPESTGVPAGGRRTLSCDSWARRRRLGGRRLEVLLVSLHTLAKHFVGHL